LLCLFLFVSSSKERKEGSMSMDVSKQTPLYEMHLKYGGKMIEFGGWSLPVQYIGIKEEHQAVRTSCGLFDVSHMGEVAVNGGDALPFLGKLVTNEPTRLAAGQVQYTPMCYPDGGVVDDLLIYKFSDTEYWLVINAANIENDWAWLVEQSAGWDVTISNLSETTAQLALQGPLAETVLAQLCNRPLADLKYYGFDPQRLVAGKPVLISRTGYTGEDGFEIYCHPEDAPALWETLLKTGQPLGLIPVGLGCRDTLRFEACLPLYGHELSTTISPLEAGLSPFVKLEKPAFNGRTALVAQKQQGLQRKLVGLKVLGRGVARAGYPVLADDGRVIGHVTSGSYAPTLEQNLALALVEINYATIGQKLGFEVRGKTIAAEVIAKPFYKRERVKTNGN
jgi:aminomethyltransferase